MIGRPGNELVQDLHVRLDYARYERKTFYRCKLVFGGGQPPFLNECDFIQSTFVFEGAAHFTVSFLAALASSPGGRELVMSIVDETPMTKH